MMVAWWPSIEHIRPIGNRTIRRVKTYQTAGVPTSTPIVSFRDPTEVLTFPNAMWHIARMTTDFTTEVQLAWWEGLPDEQMKHLTSWNDVGAFATLGKELGDLEEEIELERRGAPRSPGGIFPNPVPSRGQVASWIGSGWPLRALGYRSIKNSTGSGGLSFPGGMVIRQASNPTGTTSISAIVLPMRPVWPGFLIDTASFASFWLTIRVAVSGVRRGLRRRRGACVFCGYDRRSISSKQPCPECGGSVGSLPGARATGP